MIKVQNALPRKGLISFGEAKVVSDRIYISYHLVSLIRSTQDLHTSYCPRQTVCAINPRKSLSISEYIIEDIRGIKRFTKEIDYAYYY
jgi:hypothetical protein